MPYVSNRVLNKSVSYTLCAVSGASCFSSGDPFLTASERRRRSDRTDVVRKREALVVVDCDHQHSLARVDVHAGVAARVAAAGRAEPVRWIGLSDARADS